MKRYAVACMCCLAICLFYCMRLNLNIVIIEMVRIQNTTETNQSKGNILIQRDNAIPVPTFDWDEITKQSILGAFYYGYAVMPIPGGWLAGRIGGKRVIGFAVIWTSVLTAAIPWVSGVSVGLLITLRILDGLVQGTAMPAVYVTLGHWTVPNERSTMIGIALSGMDLGMMFSSFLSGLICSAYGWPVSFYTYSVFGVIWTVLWAKLIYETPDEDPNISDQELNYINKNISQDGAVTEIVPIPWSSIVRSSAVWAVVIAHIALDFGFYFILIETPTFLSTVLGCNVKTVGLLLSIPCVVIYPVSLLAGICADYIIQREFLSILNTRKLFTIIAFGVPAICLLGTSYCDRNEVVSITLLAIGFIAMSLDTPSIFANVMDISTKHSAIIIGIMSTLSSCTGFVGPLVSAAVIGDHSDIGKWSTLFMLTAGIQFFGMVFFLIFAKGEEQQW